jgi:hypothetical protein
LRGRRSGPVRTRRCDTTGFPGRLL